MIAIRPEKPDDAAAVSAVHAEAFGRPAEARIVERLRQAAGFYLGLVATDGGPITNQLFDRKLVAIETIALLISSFV